MGFLYAAVAAAWRCSSVIPQTGRKHLTASLYRLLSSLYLMVSDDGAKSETSTVAHDTMWSLFSLKKTLFMSVCVCVCVLMCVRACVCVGWACVEGGVSTLCDIPHSIKWLHSFWWRDMWMASLLLMVWWPTHQILSHQSNILCQTNRSVIQGKFLGWETLLFQLCTEGFSKPILFYSFIGQINDC